MKRITANQYQTSERYYKLQKVLFESECYKDMKLEVLVGNYVSGTIYLSEKEINAYNPIAHVNKDYPASFLLGSEYRTDMVSLNTALNQAGVENELVDPLAEEGLEKPHGFVANLRTDPVSAKAFERLISFIDDKAKE